MSSVVGFPMDLANSQPVDSLSGFGHTLRRSAAVSRLFPSPRMGYYFRVHAQENNRRLNWNPIHTSVIGFLWQLACPREASDVGKRKPRDNSLLRLKLKLFLTYLVLGSHPVKGGMRKVPDDSEGDYGYRQGQQVSC